MNSNNLSKSKAQTNNDVKTIEVLRLLESMETKLQSLTPENRIAISDRIHKLSGQLNESPMILPSNPTNAELLAVAKSQVVANISQLAQRRKDTILELIKKLQVLPVSSSAPMRILNLQKDKNAGASEYAKALSIDPGLSSKVLGLANSSWFSPRSPITRLTAAITAIGLRNLLPLIFSLSLTGAFGELKIPQAEKDAIWRGSLIKAACAREYARFYCPSIDDEAFLCGLLQDIGLPILLACDMAAWSETSSLIDSDDETRKTREMQLYGMDHVEVTRLVGKRLGIPETLLSIMETQHDAILETCSDEKQHLVNATRLAGLMPHRVIAQQNISVQPREHIGHYSPAGNNISIATVLSSIPQAFKELLGMLGGGESPGGLNEFLQKMSGEMSRSVEDAINLSQRHATQLETSRQELITKISALESQAAVAGDFDPMTRLLNRSGLSRRTANFFNVASEYQQECGLVHITLNNFKDLNRRCGHAQGDKILMEIGEVMRKFLKGTGIGSRISGVEFVLILLGKSRQESMKIIETLEIDLAQQAIGNDDVPLESTLRSLWIDLNDKAMDPEKILAEFISGNT
jgi:diguanylate cyclase (GGDEF)-like protein